MNSKIKVYNENNILEEVEVIDFFQLEEYDHEYVLYTKNEEVGNDVITYVSIINQIGNDEFRFEEIKDEEELKKVEAEIEKEMESLSEE